MLDKAALTTWKVEQGQIALPDARHLAAGWAITCGTELAIVHEAAFAKDPEAFGPALRALISLGGSVPATEYARLHEGRLIFAGEIDALFEQVRAFTSARGFGKEFAA